MPILELQRRLREIGRIRIGEKVETTTRQGKKATRPKKLDTFRLTSRDERAIRAAASLYGGDPRPWDDSPDGANQWEVITATQALDVVIPPGETSFSQWLELWSGGGCQRRCDGRWEVIGDQACVCDPIARECSYHTRLSVMLRELPGLGVWRLDTQGFYAATELAGAVDVCRSATERGQMLPARLRLEQRQVKRAGEQTKRFAVPVLDVDVTIGQLTSGRVETMGEIAAGDAPVQRSTPALTPVDAEALPPGPMQSVADQVSTVGEEPKRKTRANAQQPIPSTGRPPRPAAQAVGDAGEAPALPAAGPPPSRGATPPVGPSDEQRRKLFACLAELGVGDDQRHAWASERLGREVGSFSDLSRDDVSKLIDLAERPAAEDPFDDDEITDGEIVDQAPPAPAPPPAATAPGGFDPADPETWHTSDEWDQGLRARKVRRVQFIKQAQSYASTLNETAPGNLAQLVESPQLVDLMRIWVVDQDGGS